MASRIPAIAIGSAVVTWLLLLARLVLDPRAASHVGAALAGEPELGPTLVAIARRECRLQLCSVHPGDAWMARTLGEGWSTRGAHGQVARYALQYAPSWARSWPWVVDLPIVSAWLGARRAASWRCRRVKACRAWTGRA